MTDVLNELKTLSTNSGIDFYVSFRYKNGGWHKWTLLSQWPEKYPPNYRQVLPNELVIESDFSLQENIQIADEICALLKSQGVSFLRFFSGNKSQHIHTDFEGLEKIPPQLRTEIKIKLVEKLIGLDLAAKIDKSNLGQKHLILIPKEKNPKTGIPKKLIESYCAEIINHLPQDILATAQNLKPVMGKVQSISKPILKCRAVELSLKERFIDGSGRQNQLAPNVSALTRQHPQRQELRDCFYSIQVDVKPNCLECWDTANSKFSCRQLRHYMQKIGHGAVCDLCLLGVDE